jgi:DNA invertase Pin-like site-specific DNA recombinase
MKYGYVRTSPDDRITALQTAALRSVKCAYVFEDKGHSGASTRCQALRRCLKTLRAGDTLIVWRLDRLGSSLHDLVTILDDLRGRGIHFQSLSEAINSTTPKGRAMWQVVAALAECEHNRMSERAGRRLQPHRRTRLASSEGKTMAAGRHPENAD